MVRRPLGPTAPPTRLSPIPVLRPGPSPPGKGILHPSWPGVPLLEGRNQRTVRREHQQFPTLSLSSSWPSSPLREKGRKKVGSDAGILNIRVPCGLHCASGLMYQQVGLPNSCVQSFAWLDRSRERKDGVRALESLSSRSYSFVHSFIHSFGHSLIPHSPKCYLCARV